MKIKNTQAVIGKRFLKFVVIPGILALFFIEKATPNHKYAAVFYDFGLKQEKNKDFQKAITYYNKAVHFDSNFFKAYNNLGVVYQVLGNYEDAIEYLKKAVYLNPEPYESYYNLGFAYLEAGYYDRAIASFKKSASRPLRNRLCYYYMGVSYLKKRNIQKAFEMMDELRSTRTYDLAHKLQRLINKES